MSGFKEMQARQAHPAGKTRRKSGLPLKALDMIATGLAQATPRTDHEWIEGHGRRYRQLVDTDLYDAWLIAWSPSSNLELHDHGGSLGAIAVAAGSLVETYTHIRWRHPIRSRVIQAPDTLAIPASRVHEVSNPGPIEALSVHVYSPPLKSMTFYDPRPRNFLWPVSTAEGDLAALEEAAT